MILAVKIKISTRTECERQGMPDSVVTNVAGWRDMQATSPVSARDAAKKLKRMIEESFRF